MRVSTTMMNVKMSKLDMDKTKVHIVTEMSAKGELYLYSEKDLEEREMNCEQRSLSPNLKDFMFWGKSLIEIKETY